MSKELKKELNELKYTRAHIYNMMKKLAGIYEALGVVVEDFEKNIQSIESVEEENDSGGEK